MFQSKMVKLSLGFLRRRERVSHKFENKWIDLKSFELNRHVAKIFGEKLYKCLFKKKAYTFVVSVGRY